MLFFNFIEESEGIDFSEGYDIVSNTELKSKQCISCRFYYFVKKNLIMNKMSVMVAITASSTNKITAT